MNGSGHDALSDRQVRYCTPLRLTGGIIAAALLTVTIMLQPQALAEPGSEGATVTTRQAAVVCFTSGPKWLGTLVALDAKQIRFVKRGQRFPDPIRYPANTIELVQTATDLYTYDAKAKHFKSRNEQVVKTIKEMMGREARRSGMVKVVNNTGREVTFIVSGARNKLGELIRIPLEDDTRSKSNLERGLTAFAEVLGGDSGNPGNTAAPRWLIKPGASRYLDLPSGETLTTSRLEYTVQTVDGKRSDSVEFDGKRKDLEVVLGEGALAPKVLVTVGKWDVQQNIGIRLVQGKTPIRTEHKTEKAGKDRYITYSTTTGGEAYTYEVERRAGTATAEALVKNPTSKSVEVHMSVEVRFTHLILSAARVKVPTFTMAPRSERRVLVEVDTRAILGNRKATTAEVVSLTTLPK